MRGKPTRRRQYTLLGALYFRVAQKLENTLQRNNRCCPIAESQFNTLRANTLLAQLQVSSS
jgi:hypothetical protein